MKRMKLWMGFSLVILLSCSKSKDIVEAGHSRASQQQQAKSGVGDTGWESISGWTTIDSNEYKVSFFHKSFPIISNEVIAQGAIIVFAKHIPLEDERMLDKPTKLPYAVYPQPGKPAFHQYWYFTVQEGALRYQYRTNKHQYVPGASIAPPATVQFRSVIISADYLQRMGHTKNSIVGLTYEQLVSLAALTP